MIRMNDEMLTFQVRTQYLRSPHDGQALALRRAVVSLSREECSTPESYGVADTFIILLKQSCTNLVITGICIDRVRLLWVRKLENGRGYQRLAQFFERLMLFFSRWRKFFRATLLQQVVKWEQPFVQSWAQIDGTRCTVLGMTEGATESKDTDISSVARCF